MIPTDVDTTRLMLSSMLVLVAGPGLALVHRAPDDRRPISAAIGAALFPLPTLCLQWALFGYSLAYGPTRHGLIGGFAYAGLSGLIADARGHVPALAFAAFQLTSVVVAATILVVAIGGRMKRSASVALLLFWSTLVYCPIAHWTWADGGWLARLGALDFAGGGVVHLAAGVSGLVGAAFVRGAGTTRSGPGPRAASLLGDGELQRRRGADSGPLAGAALIWSASFGLVAGDAIAAHGLAARALTAVAIAALGSAAGWAAGEWEREGGRPSPSTFAGAVVIGPVAVTGAGGYVGAGTAAAIGFIAGALYSGTALGRVCALMAGLLSITAAAGYVSPMMALALALVAAVVCHGAVLLREQLGDDGPGDALAMHALGGLAGVLLTGIFARPPVRGIGPEGALFGNVRQLGVQLLACAATATYAGAVTWGIMKILGATIGVRSSRGTAAPAAPPLVERPS